MISEREADVGNKVKNTKTSIKGVWWVLWLHIWDCMDVEVKDGGVLFILIQNQEAEEAIAT